MSLRRRIAIYLLLAGALAIGRQTAVFAGDETEEPAPREIQGRVVFLGEALSRLHEIETVAESKENTLALETFDGELIPLVEDVRGRAFRRDERLREIDVQLLVRDAPNSSIVQIIGVRKLDRKANKRFELDYWCSICAIAMYELKQCECCQGEIELRLRELPADRAK